MSSLVDELLADLDEDIQEDVADVGVEENGSGQQADATNERSAEPSQRDDDVQNQLTQLNTEAGDADITAEHLTDRLQLKGRGLSGLTHLMTKLEPVLVRLREAPPPDAGQTDAVYKLLVEANRYSVDIDNEIVVVHRYVAENYEKRFGELEGLVHNRIEYARAVRIIGNNVKGFERKLPTGQQQQHADAMDVEREKTMAEKLAEVVSKPTVMVITMAAATNDGENLSETELARVYEGCDLVVSLFEAKEEITRFVSSRLSIFAPNLTRIVDPHTAAQLMGFAGGLEGIARTPNSNIPTMGSKRQVGIGFGYSGIRRQGFLYYSSIVQSVPPDARRQAMRIVSGKLVLAARVDLSKGAPDGSMGDKWREEIDERLEKLLEPPENKGTKALPVPKDMPSKKRGGRRIRKFKEQFQQTELQKAANRMTFGQAEEEIMAYDETVGLGQAGLRAGGGVRSLRVDGKTRAKMSKGTASRVNRMNAAATSRPEVSGLASSLNFTPAQGIELIDPNRLAKKRKEEEDRWFSSGTFTQINTKKSGALELGPGNTSNTMPPPPGGPLKRKTTDTAPAAKKPKHDS